jgi:hypothetical protein
MTIAPEPDPDLRRAPPAVPAADAAGQLLAAMLAVAGLAEPAAQAALAEA